MTNSQNDQQKPRPLNATMNSVESARPVVRRLLIANRGEIARRIIRTCRILDIETVAVYSDIDADAPHVHEATCAEPIGGPMAYLSVEAIVAAAKRTGADSVHPGYGFLSENPALAEALEAAGIVFIGPNAETIRALGSKTNAKIIAANANVPVAPTLLLSGDSPDEHLTKLSDFTSQVGFPVIIKAAAGGGGRGMRVINDLDSAKEALESAARESLKAFGSAEVFIERFIAPARHIEVQIAGDHYGTVVALGTRDCSLQRNNQKIVEEAPALNLKDEVRDELCQAACRLAKEVGYSNLGTVEFLYSDDGLFYFLEVNTRLQVEHPVTELVTGLDLVMLQIEIARGADLRDILKDNLSLDGSLIPSGHAIEARLCAEEYTGKFVTGTGVILDLYVPRGLRESGLIRADLGYEVCSQVSHYYDSLLGKIIVHAPNRDQAIQLLRKGLSEARVSGVGTNRSLLLHLISLDAFRKLLHTVQGTLGLLPSVAQLHDDWIHSHVILAAARLLDQRSEWAKSSPWSDREKVAATNITYPLTTLIHGVTISSESRIEDDGVSVRVMAPYEHEAFVRISALELAAVGLSRYSISLNRSSPKQVSILVDGATTWVHTDSGSLGLRTINARPNRKTDFALSGELVITSPIPGKVVAVNFTVGDSVQEGDLLIVLDSMKMEHPFKAPRSGVLSSINAIKGALVNAGAELARISSAQ